MSNHKEKLAASLEILRALQGKVIIRSSDLSRTHRERLVKKGLLIAVLKGWYLKSRTRNSVKDSPHWYDSFWEFCAAYLQERFGKKWSLAPEQSIFLHLDNWTVPRQLMVRAPRGRNKKTALPFNTSIFESRAALPESGDFTIIDNIRVFSIPAALCNIKSSFFQAAPSSARAALALITESSELLELLLKGDHSVIAGRLAGAFRDIGKASLADEIIETMQAAGYVVRETNPFKADISLPTYRLRHMWPAMQEHVMQKLPFPSKPSKQSMKYLKRIEEMYAKTHATPFLLKDFV
jgi:hypothetical protein